MPQLYARDLAITAVMCFIGGIGLTLLVARVCYQVLRSKKLAESKRQKEEEEGNSTVVNHNVSEKRGGVFLQASNSNPWDRESMMLDTRLESHGGQFQSRATEDSSHFRCLDCSTKGQRGTGPNLMRWSNRLNIEIEADEEIGKKRMRMVTEEERRKPRSQQGILSRDIPNNVNSFSQPRREPVSERTQNLPVYDTGRDMDSYRINVEGKITGNETLHCESCHRTYRPPEQTIRPKVLESKMRDSALMAVNGFYPQQRLIDKSRNHNQFDMMKNTELRRESRNVTFDLESDKREEEVKTPRDKEKEREKRGKLQSSRLLKVKLNLNPLRKSKVHPKRRAEQDHSEKSSSKKSNDKRQHGKDRQEKGGKRKSSSKTNGSGERLKKSSKSRRSSDDGVEEKEEEDKVEGKHKKTTENERAVNEENTHADNSQSGDITSAADQSAAIVTGQVQTAHSGSVQYQGPGLALGRPFSLSAAETNGISYLPLLGSAGSQLTGSSLSLQSGNYLLNTMAPPFKTAFPSGAATSAADGTAISGALDRFSKQTGVGLTSAATALLASTVHANPLQTIAIQTAPLHNAQAGELSLNLAANPTINPEAIPFQTQIPPDTFTLLARLKSNSAQGPGLQTGEELHQLLSESQAPQIKESFPVQGQAPTDGLSVATSQALGSVRSAENLSNAQTEVGRVSCGSISAGGAALAEGPAVEMPADSMLAAGALVSGVSPSSTGDAADAAILLHQEYLSEEGDSSPKRKLRLALPEKTASRPPTALERKIR